MQQILEQYGTPCSGSRDPAHWTNTTSLGSLPSDGRLTLPPVGPLAASNRSNASASITSGIWPPPYSGSRVCGNTSNPVATTIAPTCSSMNDSICWNSIELVGQNFKHAPHFSFSPLAMDCSRTHTSGLTTGLLGTACGERV